jgi:hypothetical protein
LVHFRRVLTTGLLPRFITKILYTASISQLDSEHPKAVGPIAQHEYNQGSEFLRSHGVLGQTTHTGDSRLMTESVFPSIIGQNLGRVEPSTTIQNKRSELGSDNKCSGVTPVICGTSSTQQEDVAERYIKSCVDKQRLLDQIRREKRKSKTFKTPSKTQVKASLLKKALRDMAEEYEGKLDGLAEVKADREPSPIPTEQSWSSVGDDAPPREVTRYFNYDFWYQYGCLNKMVKRFRGSEVCCNGWTVIDGADVPINGFYPCYVSGSGELVNMSKDCLFVDVIGGSRLLEGSIDTISVGGVIRSVRATLGLVDHRYSDTLADAARRVKAHYKRFHPEHIDLDEMIMERLNSQWYVLLVANYWKQYNNNWQLRVETNLSQSLGYHGYELHQYINKHLPFNTYRTSLPVPMGWFRWGWKEYYITIQWYFYVALLGYSVTEIFLWSYYVPSMLLALVTLSVMAKAFSSQSYHDVLRAFDYMIHKRSPIMQPCARLQVKKTNVDPRRIPEPTVPIRIHKLPDVKESEDFEDSYVDIYGTAIKGVPLVIPNEKSPQDLKFALMYRIAQQNGTLDDSLVSEFITFGKKFIDGLPVVEFDDVGHLEHFTNQYTVKRAQQLENLRLELLDRRATFFKIFPKAESYLGKDVDTYKTRMIGCPSEELIAHFSLLFSIISKSIAGYFNFGRGVCYSYGFTPDLCGRFARDKIAPCQRYLELDVSNWDGSLGKHFLILEQYYLETKVMWNNPDKEWLINNWFERNLVSYDGELSVTIEHGRVSGHNATSCFNSLLNIITQMFVLNYGERGIDVKTLVQGDDGITGTNSKKSTEDLVGLYSKLGMKLEVVEHQDAIDLGFCSGRFWLVDGIWRWQTLPFRALAKLGTNHSKQPMHLYHRLLVDTAMSMGPVAGSLPIVSVLLTAIIDSANQLGIKRFRQPKKDYDGKIGGGVVVPYGNDTMQMFCERYGFDRWTVEIIEQQIISQFTLTATPYMFTDPDFERCAKIDLGYEDMIKPPSMLSDVRSLFDYTIRIPLEEEIEKLKGTTTLVEALNRAIEFGSDEDEELGTTTHQFLHPLFTCVSYFNLQAGVGLHSAYNRLALTLGGYPATRRKNRVVFEEVKCYAPPPKPKVKTRKKKRKAKRKVRFIDPYEFATLWPFTSKACGAKSPDNYVLPTATATLRGSGHLGTPGSSWTSGNAALYTPWYRSFVYLPASISVGGTVTWTGGTKVAAMANTTLASVVAGFRVSGWGLKVMGSTGFDNSTGYVGIAHVPGIVDQDSVSFTYAPTTWNALTAANLVEIYSLAELCVKPVYVVGRRMDNMSQRFVGDSYLTSGDVAAPSSGWMNIVIFISGVPADVADVLKYEWISHIEYTVDLAAANVVDATPFPMNVSLEQKVTNATQELPITVPEGTAWYETFERAAAAVSNGIGTAAGALYANAPVIRAAYDMLSGEPNVAWRQGGKSSRYPI